MQNLIITVALTGNVPTREMNANLPVTPDAIAKDVRRCADAGASLFHVHARDVLEKPTLNPSVFMDIVQHIKAVSPDVIVQLSTGGRAGKNWEDRAEPIKLLPEMGSFTTGSANLPGMIYENSPQFIEFLASVYHQTRVKPEIEVFEAGMITNALFLQKKGLLTPPLHFNFVLGAPGAMSGTARNLVFLAEGIPQGSTWTATGIGKSQIPLAAMAIAMGGHVRVGLEDNLFLPGGEPASNVRLVEKITAIAGEIGRQIASPDEARALLSLNPAWKNRIIDPQENQAPNSFTRPVEQRYFEDYIIGESHTFGSITVEADEVISFARRFDPQPFHTDPEAGKRSIYGGMIASGWHTAALMMRLFVDHYLSSVASLGSPGVDELRWLKPVFPGDVLSLHVTIVDANRSRSKPDRGIIRSDIRVLNQHHDVVMTMKALNFLSCRERISVS